MRVIFSAIFTIALLFGMLVAGCDIGLPSSGVVSRHVPEITQFVLGMTLADSNVDFGRLEKTDFNRGDLLLYGFRAQDSAGDWGKMVHIVQYTDQIPDFLWYITNYFPDDQTTDLSWDFSNDFINLDRIAVDKSPYRFEKSGTYRMTWYIVDRAGNMSNVIISTITVR